MPIPEHVTVFSVLLAQDFGGAVVERDVGQVDDHGDVHELFTVRRGHQCVVARVAVERLVVADKKARKSQRS